jgi:hypothetical protein
MILLRSTLFIMPLIMPMVMSGCARHMNVTEKMMWSTYPLLTQKGAATGFIINHRNARVTGGVTPVLFTSVHVLETIGSGPLIIGFRKPDAAGETDVSLLAFIPSKQRGKEPFYVRHPSHDLAAFALYLPPEVAGLARLPSSLVESGIARNGKSLRSGAEVSFLGYPEVLPGTEGAFPVLRSGRVSSYPVGTPQAHGRFLINSDVYPGDSGAPVFLIGCGRRPELVGMIIQRISPTADKFSHLAVAVDADVIRETLALLTTRDAHPIPVVKTSPKSTR